MPVISRGKFMKLRRTVNVQRRIAIHMSDFVHITLASWMKFIIPSFDFFLVQHFIYLLSK